MPNTPSRNTNRKAYIFTGPTSGTGYAIALELVREAAKRGGEVK